MKRRKFTAAFKRRVVLEALRGEETVAFDRIAPWRAPEPGEQVEGGGARGFAGGACRRQGQVGGPRNGTAGGAFVRPDRRVDGGTGFLFAGFGALGRAEKVRLIREDGTLSLSRKCALVGVSRSSLHCEPRLEDGRRLELLSRVDRPCMEFPHCGTRRASLHLRREGRDAGRDLARRLMAAVNWRTVHPGPRTSKPQSGRRIHPCLLGGLDHILPGEAVCADITCIPVRGGHLYLVAIMDWASRFVLSWELDNTLEVGFCVSALEEALERHGAPLISNTDQGSSQFTSEACLRPLLAAGVRISMDGRGRWIDNRFIERLWRSLKYEAVYLEELVGGHHARRVIASWLDHYNHRRPHLALEARAPAEACLAETSRRPWKEAA